MSDWIEFKCIKEDGNWNGTKTKLELVSLRAYEIVAVSRTGSDSCILTLGGERNQYHSVAEPYEDIMAKIEQAEGPVDLSNCVLEPFTKEDCQIFSDILQSKLKLEEVPKADAIGLLEKLDSVLKKGQK